MTIVRRSSISCIAFRLMAAARETDMAGISFSCGTFEGREKAGSALSGVLNGLDSSPGSLVDSLRSEFNARGRLLIPEEQVKLLLPLLINYWQQLVAEMGHDDWTKEDEAETKAGLDPVEAKWGAGWGWRLLCTTDLIRACKTSLAEHQPARALLW